MHDLPSAEPPTPECDLPEVDLESTFEAVVSDPTTASKRWVYRQYDHEVGVRTAVAPGDDAAILAVREAGGDGGGEGADAGDTDGDATGDESVGLALASGAVPRWTSVDPYDGARAVALENASNLAAKGAVPLAAVDCLNGGNPEKPDVYGGFEAIVDGLADACSALDTPVVGGNVSLYNDSVAGPIPPTPTLAVLGTRRGVDAPPAALDGTAADASSLVVVGGLGETDALGGSAYLAATGGTDRFPSLPAEPADVVASLARVARLPSTLASHDVSEGGLAVTLAELVDDDAGAAVTLPTRTAAFAETPGRLVVQTTDPAAVRDAAGELTVTQIGDVTTDGSLSLTVDEETLTVTADAIRARRDVIAREMA
jgi:phosphoribosylformylglycinamidine synthase